MTSGPGAARNGTHGIPAATPPVREILVVGAGGMLGTALQRVAAERGLAGRAYTEAELDITDEASVRSALAGFAIRLNRAGVHGAVVNAAAYTDVDAAEDDAERACLVNGVAPGRLAAAARDEGLTFVHVSTDFVFDGEKEGPYAEDDSPHPISIYGASKLAGECAVAAAYPQALVVRTAWAYGSHGANFPAKILAAARRAIETGVSAAAAGATTRGPTLRVVTDQVGSPTYTIDLAGGLLDLLAAGAMGLYHLTGGGRCSRYELALETLRIAGVRVPEDLAVEPMASDAFPTRAGRPANSTLDCGRAAALGVRLPAWQDGLARYVAESPGARLPTA
jgi:dTDP-4-dehydrorhamnose reductase